MVKHSEERTNLPNKTVFRVDKLLHSYRAQAVLFCCAAIYGMIWSAEAIISIAMISLVTVAVFRLSFPQTADEKYSLTLRPNISKKIKTNAFWFWISIPFLLVFLSLFYSEDWTYLLERLRIKLPFLLLPFAFFSIPKFTRQHLRVIALFFVFAVTIAGIGVLWNYVQHFSEINDMIGRGKPIPTPSNHIRFSLAVTCGIFIAGTLSYSRSKPLFKYQRIAATLSTIFLFALLHILSVRSGLVAFYGATFVMIMQYVYRSRQWFKGGLILFFLAAVPYLAMQFIPSFQKKFYYVRHDFYSYFRGQGEVYSDSGRILSLQAGLELIQEHPILGVGAGDLKKEMHRIYEKNDLGEHAKMPHSQLMSVAAGTGLISLILFLLAFFLPLFYRKNYQSYLFTALHVIFFLSFFSENTFENNYGISLWLFALLIGMNYLTTHSTTSNDRSI